MPNDRVPPEEHRQQAEGVTREGRGGRPVTEEHRISAESARTEAEQFRRFAEEAREVRDRHREALESLREERERLREAAETARTAGEEARAAAEAARHAAMDAVQATAETLQATLENMKAVEEMRRTLRDIRDVNKLGSNYANLSLVKRWLVRAFWAAVLIFATVVIGGAVDARRRLPDLEPWHRYVPADATASDLASCNPRGLSAA